METTIISTDMVDARVAPKGSLEHLSQQEIEKLLGRKVFLSLHVKVAKDWQRDPKQLRRLGFD